MKKYFLHNGKDQHGPYSLDELKQKGLTAKTMIWFDGISSWTEAQFIPELKEFATATPPPFEKTNPINQTFDKAKKVLDKDYVNEIEGKISNKGGKKIFKYALILLSILGLVFIINLMMPSQERTEKNNPTEYLTLKDALLRHMNPNGYFDGPKPLYWKIEGKLTNSSKLVTYKDVQLEIEFFTKTNSFLGKRTIKVIQIFPPNNLQDKYEKYTYFEVRVDEEPPKDTDRDFCKIKIIGADVYENEKASQ